MHHLGRFDRFLFRFAKFKRVTLIKSIMVTHIMTTRSKGDGFFSVAFSYI